MNAQTINTTPDVVNEAARNLDMKKYLAMDTEWRQKEKAVLERLHLERGTEMSALIEVMKIKWELNKPVINTAQAKLSTQNKVNAVLTNKTQVSQVQQETRGLFSRIFGALVGNKSENNGLQHGAV